MTEYRASRLDISKIIATPAEDADYTPSSRRIYAGNPLIEAIAPPPANSIAAATRMSLKPLDYDTKQVAGMSQRERLDRIDDLDDLHVPTGWHTDKEQRLTAILLKGLRARNPLTPEGAMHLVSGGKKLSVWQDPAQRPEGSICLILGMSGMGKTSFIKGVARCWGGPVIQHRKYKGKDFFETQIVYLKVNCPADRSLKGLAANLIFSVVQLIGPDKELHGLLLNKQVTANILCTALRYLIANYHIGLLVIDEIRNLFLRSKNPSHDNFKPEDSEIVAFLLNLRDELKIPIILVGTPEVGEHFDTSLSMNRRLTRDGAFELNPPSDADDPDWKLLCEKAWEYQWTLKHAKLTDDLMSTLFHCTAGIPGVLIALLQSAQRLAIQLEPEIKCINKDLVMQAYNTEFKRLHPILEGIRENDATAKARWNDIWVPEVEQAA